jgi:diguanylate cyclase (GGDEF)-like protein/PAS domain S-box-containing protein
MALTAVVALRPAGPAGDTPPPFVVAALLAVVVWQHPRAQHRISEGDPQRLLSARITVHLLLATAVMYLAGWGALPAVLLLHVLTRYLREVGSRAWRPFAVAGTASIALGELALWSGLLHGYLPRPQSHGVALLIALGTLATGHTLSRAAARHEDVERRLRTSEERFRALVRDGSDVITLSAADDRITWISQAVAQVMGYFPNDLTGRRLRDYVHPDDLLRATELHERVLASDGGSEHTAELRYRHADGEWRWHEVIARNMLAHPDVRAVIGHHQDITERRAAQERIAYAASYDSLTGLTNGPTLTRDLERALAQGTRYQHRVGLLFLDLDGFKQVNDTYGHAAGDRLLTAVAEVVRRSVRDTDTVGRLGGDEFGVVLSRVGSAQEAIAVARRIIAGIEGIGPAGGRSLDVGCSIGVAIAVPGGSDAKSLLRHADTAMYRAKRRARNGYQLYVEQQVTAPWEG